MTQPILIITLLILVIYLYYRLNNLTNNSGIPELKKQVSYYQESSPRLEQKIADLETALLNLAQQKIKLETNWKNDKANWAKQHQVLQQELQAKNNWANDHIPQLKQELFGEGQATYQELAKAIDKAWFTKGKGEVKSKLAELEEFFPEPDLPLTKTADELD